MSLSDHLRAKDWTFAGTSRVAQKRNEFALYVLIASLGMFFFAALLGYVLIRWVRIRAGDIIPPLHLPWILWISTAFALGGSALLFQSLRSVRRERQGLFRKQLLAAFVLGLSFCVTQSIGLTAVFLDHLEVMRQRPAPVEVKPEIGPPKPTIIVPPLRDAAHSSPTANYPVRQRPRMVLRLEGILFVLILLHALHFVAGMIALTIVTVRGLKGRYDHEYHGGVRMCAFYWRFLDVVWLALFGTFLLTA
jgi:heme/copper-type cytochrome/quinol oxidase subunit 3